MEAVAKVWFNLWTALSWPFTAAIIVLMVWDITSHYIKEGRNHRQFAGLMTGVGILGTFFGVVVGLQDFDPDNVGASIGPLLEGLKVSFATSVAGIFAAVTTEVVERALPSKRAKVGDPVADSINQHMLDLSELIEGAKTANESVANNVAGLRTEMRDESAQVRKALEDALVELSKGATEEIIQALEGVIKDFNDNLTEQFGENFKQLNEACLNLVQWQGEYQQAVEAATEAIRDARTSMDSCREQFEAAVPQKEKFFEIVANTGLSIKALAALNDRLDGLATSQADVISKFSSALDEVRVKAGSIETEVKQTAATISQKQTELIDGFQKVVTSAEAGQTRLSETLSEHARGHKKVSDNIEEVVKKLNSGNEELKGHLGKSLNDLESTLASLTLDFGSAYSRYLEGMRKLTGSGD